MNNLKNIIYTVAGIGIFSGILDMISSTTKHKNYVKYGASLLVVLLFLTPLSNFVNLIKTSEIQHYPEYDTYKNEQKDYFKETIQTAIRNDITTKFSMPDNSVSVKISTKESLIENVEITIKNESYFRYAERIEAYAKESYGCEIKVIQEFETG